MTIGLSTVQQRFDARVLLCKSGGDCIKLCVSHTVFARNHAAPRNPITFEMSPHVPAH